MFTTSVVIWNDNRWLRLRGNNLVISLTDWNVWIKVSCAFFSRELNESWSVESYDTKVCTAPLFNIVSIFSSVISVFCWHVVIPFSHFCNPHICKDHFCCETHARLLPSIECYSQLILFMRFTSAGFTVHFIECVDCWLAATTWGDSCCLAGWVLGCLFLTREGSEVEIISYGGGRRRERPYTASRKCPAPAKSIKD